MLEEVEVVSALDLAMQDGYRGFNHGKNILLAHYWGSWNFVALDQESVPFSYRESRRPCQSLVLQQ